MRRVARSRRQAHENRVLTQTRGAEPYRGMLRVGARCCSCWEHRPGGRTFSADPALACRRSLPTGLLRNSAHHKGTCPRATPRVIHNSRRDRQDMHQYPPRCDNESTMTVLRINRASASTLAPPSAHSDSRTLDEPGDGSAGTMSVLERLYRIPDSATMSPRPDGLPVFPPPPSVRSGPDGDGWPTVDRAAPSVRPAPTVAARACLMIAGQDSSPIQRAHRPATRVSALHRVDRWGSPSQPVDSRSRWNSEQVSRWETDGGRTRELT